MKLAKLDVFVCIETLRSYVEQLGFRLYRATYRPRLTARYAKVDFAGRKNTSIRPKNNGERLFGLMIRAFVWTTVNAVKEYSGRKESVMANET